MRHVEQPPRAVVESRGGRTVAVTRLGEIGKIAGRVVEITGRLRRVPKGKTPAGVYEQPLARRSLHGIVGGENRRCKHSAEQQRANDRIHRVNGQIFVLHDSIRRSSRYPPPRRRLPFASLSFPVAHHGLSLACP